MYTEILLLITTLSEKSTIRGNTMKATPHFTYAILIAFFAFCVDAFSQKTNNAIQFEPNELMIRMYHGYYDANKVNSELSRVGCEVVWQALKPEESITFNSLSLPLAQDGLAAFNMNELRNAESYVLRTFRVRYQGNQSPEVMARIVKQKVASVEIAEAIPVEKVFTTPNDPLLSSQKNHLDVMKVLEAWEVTKGDSNIIIAIIDNGIDITHVELENNVVINTSEIPGDSIDNDGNGYVDDYKGVNLTWKDDGSNPNDYSVAHEHGTQAAGNACAMPDNKAGGLGTGFLSKLLAIKAGKVGSSGVHRGYEGIMYAAKRNVHVISCSWGTPNYNSPINNSIVQYAISRGCAVVAAAGNSSDDSIYFPANYYGVLGVGNSYYYDQKAISSSYGVACDIMAPGENFFTIFPGNSYANFSGTSSACPLVAGIIAVTRSVYPQLTGVQAAEHVRQTADVMDIKGTPLEHILPSRANMLRAVTENPMSRSSIVCKNYSYEVRKGTTRLVTNKFEVDDTVEVTLIVHNRLAKANNVVFTVSQPYINEGSVQMIDSVATVAVVESGEDITLNKFLFVVKKESLIPELLRVSITADTQKPDFFLINFVPTNDMSDFSTDSLTISAGDKGFIGFGGMNNSLDRRGKGLELKSYENFIYNGSLVSANNSSGFFVTYADSNKSVGAFASSTDFRAKKMFNTISPTIRIVDDSTADATNKIGVEVYTDFAVRNDIPNAIKVLHKVKNVSGKTLQNIAMGYFFDFDIGPQGEDNKTALFPEALPDGCMTCAAEIISREGGYPYIGLSVRSERNEDVPAAAGLTKILDDDIVNLQEKIAMINSGTSIQTSTIGDVQAAIGTKFSGSILPDETRMCEICFGAAWSKEKLAQSLKDCMSSITSVQNEVVNSDNMFLYPNPTTGIINIQIRNSGLVNGYVSDILGRIVYEFPVNNTEQNYVQSISVQHLNEGIYFVHVGGYVKKLIVRK